MKYLKLLLKIIGLIVVVMALLFGHGMLMKPKIKISCGAVDLAVTARLKANLMFLSLLFEKDEAAQKVTNGFEKSLKEFGLSDEKIKIIMKEKDKKNVKLKKDDAQEDKIDLEPYEERIIMAALSKATQDLTMHMAEQFSVPDSVAFFQVENSGWTDAQDVHVVLRLNGKYFSDRIDSHSPITSKTIEGNKYVVNLKTLSPGAKLKGVIWYEGSMGKTLFKTNSISVNYKDGLKEADFEENLFFIDR